MIEFALAAFLATKTPVTTLVGDRIHAEKTPQGVTGARIVYSKTGGERHYHSTGSSGLVTSTIVLTFHANKGGVIDTATAVYEAVRLKIDGFSGTMGTIDVRRCVLSPYRYGSAVPSQGDEVGSPAVNATATIIHRESVPEFT